MKKPVTILILVVMLTSLCENVWAAPRHRRPVVVNRRPHVTVIERNRHHNDGAAIAAGVAGLAVGAMIGAAAANRPAPPPQTVIVQQPVVVAPPPPMYGGVVYVLPGGCSGVTVDGIQYYQCGGLYHRPYMGNSGVYYQIVPPPL